MRRPPTSDLSRSQRAASGHPRSDGRTRRRVQPGGDRCASTRCAGNSSGTNGSAATPWSRNLLLGFIYLTLRSRWSQHMFPGARSSQADHVKRPRANPGAENVQARIVIPVDDHAARRTRCVRTARDFGTSSAQPEHSDWCFSGRLESDNHQSFQLCSPASRQTATMTHPKSNAPRSDDEPCSRLSNPRPRSDRRA